MRKLGMWSGIGVILVALVGAGCSDAGAALPSPPTPIVAPATATATPVPPTQTPVPPTETPVPPTETPIPPTPSAVVPTQVNGIQLRTIQDPFVFNYPVNGMEEIRTQAEAEAAWIALVVENHWARGFNWTLAEAVGNDFDRAIADGRIPEAASTNIEQSITRDVEGDVRTNYFPSTRSLDLRLNYEGDLLVVELCYFLDFESVDSSGKLVDPDGTGPALASDRFTGVRSIGFTVDDLALTKFANDILTRERETPCW